MKFHNLILFTFLINWFNHYDIHVIYRVLLSTFLTVIFDVTEGNLNNVKGRFVGLIKSRVFLECSLLFIDGKLDVSYGFQLILFGRFVDLFMTVMPTLELGWSMRAALPGMAAELLKSFTRATDSVKPSSATISRRAPAFTE